MHWESKSQRRESSWRCCSGILESALSQKQALASVTVELGCAGTVGCAAL